MITHHIVTMLPSKNAENLRNYGKYDERGSIGIGAMIVFIALILVAAVASTVIIKTAEELQDRACLLYTSPSPRDVEESRMPSSA